MLRRVALVRTDVSEELSASIIRETTSEQGTTSNVVVLRIVRRLPVTANVASLTILVTLIVEALSSSETSFPTSATRRNIREDSVLLRVKVTWSRSRQLTSGQESADLYVHFPKHFDGLLLN
jgi:hypothetical protein